MEATTRKSPSNSDSIAAGLAPMVDRVATTAHDAVDKAASAAKVVDRVAATAHDAVDKAASAANAAAKTIGQKGDELNKLQARYLDVCREQVRGNPLAALGIALAAGFVISFLLSRR